MKQLREPVNGLTHLAGAILAVFVLAVLVGVAARSGKVRHLVAFVIFGASLVALYTSSALYHLLPVSARALERLRRLDHIMIFLLIAGTYTPFCLIALCGAWRWGLLGAVWGIALVGMILKFLWLDAPVWLSTTLYLAQGWVALVAVPMLWRSFPTQALLWVAAGGAVYTVGAIIFAIEWPTIRRGIFEAHELWHILVLLGSACHVWTVARYLVPLH